MGRVASQWKLLFWLLLSLSAKEQHAIMSITEDGVYSLFPHEDLRSGRKLYSPEDRARGLESQRDPRPSDRYHFAQDNLPSKEPSLVPILRPSFPTPYGQTANSLRNYDSYEKGRGDGGNHRSFYGYRRPRVYFRDEERRIHGYGNKYHQELPPFLDDHSRETNFIRPSQVDYSRGSSEEYGRRYLPNYGYFPQAKLPPSRATDSDNRSGERTRIHVFTSENIDRFSHIAGRNGHRQPAGPSKVDVPAPGAFLNHEEYLEFHTKLALETLNREKQKLEEASKLLFTPTSKPLSHPRVTTQHVDGLVPPNSNNVVTKTTQDAAVTTLADRPGDSLSSNHRDNGDTKFLPRPTVVSTADSGNNDFPKKDTPSRDFSVDKKVTDSNGKAQENSLGSQASSTETGFLPIAPFHLQGLGQDSLTTTSYASANLDGQSNPMFGFTSTDRNLKDTATETSTMQTETTNTFTNVDVDFIGNQLNETDRTTSSPDFQASISNMQEWNTGSTLMTTDHANGRDIENTGKFQRNRSFHFASTTRALTNSKGSVIGVLPGSAKDNDELFLQSPSIFIDSKEATKFYAVNVTSEKNAVEKTVNNVRRVKTSAEGRDLNQRDLMMGNGIRDKNRTISFAQRPHVFPKLDSALLSTNYTGPVEVDINYGSVAVTGDNGNGSVVAKVHAHISRCPKLYGAVEIICDVSVQQRHGRNNPQLIVGWVRKFYNTSTPDVLLAVNKDLAYVEDFHDKFNVTLATGVSPMLRSVLIIREVAASDCGNYECEVFDGYSTHRSETLVFLCL